MAFSAWPSEIASPVVSCPAWRLAALVGAADLQGPGFCWRQHKAESQCGLTGLHGDQQQHTEIPNRTPTALLLPSKQSTWRNANNDESLDLVFDAIQTFKAGRGRATRALVLLKSTTDTKGDGLSSYSLTDLVTMHQVLLGSGTLSTSRSFLPFNQTDPTRLFLVARPCPCAGKRRLACPSSRP